MVDRIGAELYGILFEVLAQNPDEETKALAKQFFDLVDTSDFSYAQMGVDEALITLGLAEQSMDAEGNEQIRYFGDVSYTPLTK
jgi:hypothetical protein